MKAEHIIDAPRELASPPPTSAAKKTSGGTPQVAPKATWGKLRPRDCTIEQLFEIVIAVARKSQTAKEVIAEHKAYIIRLKTEVFKVRFGSVGVKVVVRCKAGVGLPAGKKMGWKEFCKRQFGVSADWINRICGGEAKAPGKTTRGCSKSVKLDSRQQEALVRAQLAANEIVAALKHGGDWQTPLAEYEHVAVTPGRLNAFLDALSPEGDYKTLLMNLVHSLEPCTGSLPVQATHALHAAQKMLKVKVSQKITVLGERTESRVRSKFLVVRGDARRIPLADNSVQCVVTSPPYFRRRRYAGNQELIWGWGGGVRA
jgi:hypothetical protein